MPAQAQEVVGKGRKEEMDLVGHKTNISSLSPIEMKTEDPKDLLYLAPYPPKLTVPLLLRRAYPTIPSTLSQNPIIEASLPAPLLKGFRVISLIGKDSLFLSGKENVHCLRVVDIGRSANKFGHELMFGVYGNMVFITIDHLTSLFGESGLRVSFSWIASGFYQASIDDLSGLKLIAFLSQLTFKLLEADSIKIHGFKGRSEAGDGRVVRDGVGGGKPQEAAVEEVAVEHDFHFGVGVTVDLLDDEDFEHEGGVVGRTADRRGVEFGEDFFEGFPIDEAVNLG